MGDAFIFATSLASSWLYIESLILNLHPNGKKYEVGFLFWLSIVGWASLYYRTH